MQALDQDTGLEVLTEEECWRLMATQYIGRVGLVVAGRPLVLPVNYALDGTTVVFRTASGSTFDTQVRGADVAFEIDAADPAYHTGWSVLGRGTAQSVVDPTQRQHLERLALRPWARSDPPGWVRVAFHLLTGRRIVQLPKDRRGQ